MKYTFKHTILAGVALGALAFSGYLLQEVTSGGKAGTAHAASDKAGQGHGGGQGGKAGAGKGAGGSQQGKGGRSLLDDVLSPGHDKDQEDHDDEGHETEDDSDRPDWAGQSGRDGKPGNPNQTPGSSKGGLYGDLFAILRDDNGVPILYVWEDQDGDGVPDTAVQSDDGYPQPVDAEGNLIPLSEEGEPVSDENVTEIEFSRLNVARSPTRVLSSRYLEAITSINQADELSLDSAGRLVITVDGESRTIDSPLENLAIYVELMNTGTLDGVTLDAETLGDLAFMADGQFTVEDQKAAASFLAGAADKFGELTVDIVAYLNTNLLGLDGSIVGPNGQSYIDFSDFTYDRESAYGDISTTVLIEVSDGVWEEQTINVYDSVFNGEAYSSDSGINGFSQAADDALQVIEYVHEFEVPAG